MLGYSYIRYKELRKLITLSWWKRYLYQKQLVLSWCKSGSWLQENCAVWHSEEVLEILTISQVYMCFLKSRGKIIKKKNFVVVCLLWCRFRCIHFSVSGHHWGMNENMTLQMTHTQISSRQTSSGQIKSVLQGCLSNTEGCF